ncbi:ABC transporter ATP-binding protein [Paenibacillaceae bacterium]|nr:ABC transporter ATP-binding protein [Paenibacillaceae bacterium]
MTTAAEDGHEILLKVEQVKKKIRNKWIISDVSFDVRAGEIFGFLGPNGSGKTTTIRMLVDLIKPTAGKITICGFDVHRQPEQALQHIGCIVENPEMYDYLTGWENLAQFARMHPDTDAARIEEVVRIVGMNARIHDKVKTYSLGMRQRLGIAQALLGRPKLLILDEPTNGLDPKGIKELREFVRQLAEGGISLFISSHLLSEIQLMCDRVAIINAGRVLAVGAVDELVSQTDGYVLWQFGQEHVNSAMRILQEERALELLEARAHGIDEALLAALPGAIVTRMDEHTIPQVVNRLVLGGIDILAIHKVAPTLEQLFLKLTEGEGIV